uniref:BEL1-like homeodomain protein 1 n=1 Tax=Erigeron canadensis TaxID=72917 RepID=UPI001CB91921|nr:BEL1-like homeodomain protein 1 [Erigeron canadensis]XP_043631373.1 BEL1-like homeodomain protein 1 [Erigeron canadensis]
MATYYNGNSEIQGGDGLQTLVLMNPGYVNNYSDTQQQQSNQGNFMFLNNHHQTSLQSNTSQTQQFVGIPLSTQHDISGLHAFMPRVQYNMYNPVEMAAQSHDITRIQQGLSLSLSSQQPGFNSQPLGVATTNDEGRGAPGGTMQSGSAVTNGVSSMQSVLLNSKYLKATHELLEEVVSVGKGVFKNSDQASKNLKSLVNSGDGSPAGTPKDAPIGEETSTKHGSGPELTTAERQEVQMKKAKLVNMLDEVEQRYRQYHNQMQIVISWFEQAAGIGSAKTYTALALQTISKQFRCLKDAIMGQIKTASRSLGEEDNFIGGGGKGEGVSRLKFVDNQLRQQRALQQLGMIQHNAWRPQRGLPERSVSVLRAWLFEHFLHPYPKDSDKHMLAKQTGLTRGQVSNWFINARVRLWKPMVEEMYLEEIKDQEQNGSNENNVNKSEQSEDNSLSKHEESVSPEDSKQVFNQLPPQQMSISNAVSTSPTSINFQSPPGFTLINSSQMEGMTQFSPKKPRNNERQQNSDNSFTLMGNPTDFMGSLGGYPIGEIGRFTTEQFQPQYSGNGVSLTLGLPHCDNLSMSGTHQNFLPNQSIQQSNEFEAMNQQSSSHSAAMYETMNIQNQKRFGAQPLPDFVA